MGARVVGVTHDVKPLLRSALPVPPGSAHSRVVARSAPTDRTTQPPRFLALLPSRGCAITTPIPSATGPVIGSLCTGYGGLDQAVTDVLGGTLAWVADTDPAASAILAHHHPDTPNLGDIRSADWTSVAPVDVVTAGIPCQPISNAGKRQGVSDERWLWPAASEALRILRPRYFYLENVSAIRKRGLSDVLAGLATLGYDARWTCLRASAVGAPHHRDRLFLLATDARRLAQDPHGEPLGERWQPAPGETPRGRARPEPSRRSRAPATDAPDLGRERTVSPWFGRSGSADGRRVLPSDTPGDRWHQGRPQPKGKRRGSHVAVPRDATPQALTPLLALTGTWGRYADAVARWENLTGHPAPPPTEPVRGNARLSTRLVEWMMGLPPGHVTDVPGLSRNAVFRVLGNGVVPRQGAEALRLLLT